MDRRRRSTIFAAIAVLFLTASLFLGAIAAQANDHRWRQGPVVYRLSPTHGFHEMDILLLGAAGVSAAVALIAALIARR